MAMESSRRVAMGEFKAKVKEAQALAHWLGGPGIGQMERTLEVMAQDVDVLLGKRIVPRRPAALPE